MKSSQKIQISIKDHDRHIKINLPPKTDLFEKSLGLISDVRANNNEEISDEIYNDYGYPRRISKQLLKNKKFKKVFNKVSEEFEDWYYYKCKIPNIQIITNDKNKLLTSYKLDTAECKKIILSSLNHINAKNIKFILIHVSGRIYDDEKQMILDNLYQIFTFVPLILFKSDRNSDSILVEIMFFGKDVEKYRNDDFW